ncbi:MAG: M48 family metalloprotease [Chlamydiia bacterium]|nr:M48 family metalloprotease [Chlamydiia bacterium]
MEAPTSSITNFNPQAAFQADVKEKATEFVSLVQSAMKLIGIIQSIGKICSESTEESRQARLGELNLGDVRLIPTTLENTFGKSQLNKLCPTSKENATVKTVTERIFPQLERKDLQPEVRVLESLENNQLALPGGNVVLTSKLVDDLKEEKNIAAIVAFNLAQADQSHMVKQTQLEVLFPLAQKLSSVAIQHLTAPKDDKDTAAQKMMRQTVTQNLETSSDILLKMALNNLKQAQTEEAKAKALEYLSKAGYEMKADELDALLNQHLPAQNADSNKALLKGQLQLALSQVITAGLSLV